MKTIFIEQDLDSFSDFHDGEWFKEIFDTLNDTKYIKSFETFITHWWGYSRAFVLPHLLIDSSCAIHPLELDKEELWRLSLDNNAFKGALWKTAENAYIGLYYCYENLLINVVKDITKQPIAVIDRNFNKRLQAVFSDSVASKLWCNSKVKSYKEIRNSIVHNAGMATPKLLKLNPKILIKNNEILLSASDTKKLSTNLKTNVNILKKHLLSQE